MSRDGQLQQAVMAELDWDPTVNAAHIGVAARDGIVTLTGHVPNFWEKEAAEKAAARVKGVRAVVEELEVELLGNPVADERIAEEALASLARDASLPKDIRVQVEHGHLTLTGEVEWKFQQDAALIAVRKLPGVTWISNHIAIRPRVDIVAVRQKIQRALERIAPFEADNIVIEADGGSITLTGEVGSRYERDLVENAAWSVPGVTEVHDRITIGW